jgi:hypothetical protein
MQISSMSLEEYVSIVGHYNQYIHGPTIDPRILERGYSEAQLAELKTKMKSQSRTVTSLNIKFNRPIEEFIYPQMSYILTLFRNYEKGQPPFPGAISEQPAQIMEIFNTLESLDLENKQRQLAKESSTHKGLKRGR